MDRRHVLGHILEGRGTDFVLPNQRRRATGSIHPAPSLPPAIDVRSWGSHPATASKGRRCCQSGGDGTCPGDGAWAPSHTSETRHFESHTLPWAHSQMRQDVQARMGLTLTGSACVVPEGQLSSCPSGHMAAEPDWWPPGPDVDDGEVGGAGWWADRASTSGMEEGQAPERR